MLKKCYNKGMIKRRCKITFIRHGATIYTEADRLSDKDNYPPLNETGKEEIEKVSQWIKKRGLMVDKIFCSPETRVTQSAGILSKICKKDFEIIPDLTAKKSGTWSGLSSEQIEKIFNSGDVTPGDFGALNGRLKFLNLESLDSKYITDELCKTVQAKSRSWEKQRIGF